LTLGRYLPILLVMRRRRGILLPIEVSILEAAVRLRGQGQDEFHGFLVAKEMREADAARRLTAHGTLYKALDRMERAGLLESHWEDPTLAAEAGRPRRRLYRITGLGDRAALTARESVEPTIVLELA
jgi:PadR family transcriptional regulator, regulatory protein PadR